MTQTKQDTLKERLVLLGLDIAPSHGIHAEAVPRVVDRVLEWHDTDEERADEELLIKCLHDTLDGEPSACDVIIPITTSAPWNDLIGTAVVAKLVRDCGADREYIRVCKFLGIVHVHVRLPGSTREAARDARQTVEEVVKNTENMGVAVEYIQSVIVLPESAPNFCV